jgi:hypothetical protein
MPQVQRGSWKAVAGNEVQTMTHPILEAESSMLAANLCEAPGSDEYGNHECQTIKTLRAELAKATSSIARITSERDRLRAALEPFAEVAAGIGWDVLQSDELAHIYGPRLSAGYYIEAVAFRRALAAIRDLPEHPTHWMQLPEPPK